MGWILKKNITLWEDIDVLISNKSVKILIFQGGDAKKLSVDWVNKIKMSNAKCYANSEWVSKQLRGHGLLHKVLPISATIPDIDLYPRGDSIYIYSCDDSKKIGDFYGDAYLPEIKKITGLNIIRATIKTYNKKELYEIYKKCFINLRLTNYDGCPNTNLEMGLMGRKSIFNGQIPYSIKWNNIKDICENIMIEYKSRKEDNTFIREAIIKYVNISDDFLIIKD